MDIQVLSTAFNEGETIPVQYTCDGDNASPPLRWGRLPKDSQSLALICEDPDAPSGTFVHWLIFNLPPIVSDLPEALPATESLVETGAIQGRNDFNNIGYDGPCPPSGNSHRNYFGRYPPKPKFQWKRGARRGEFNNAWEGKFRGEGILMEPFRGGASRVVGY